MEIIGFLWDEVVTRPMTNGLVFFYSILGGNFGLAIIVFTIFTRVILYPLTLRQLRSTKAMQELQPRIKEIQERYKNDRQRLQREQMRLFREAGVNPLGCLGPLIIQMPIWIGLFWTIRRVVADTPEKLVELSEKLYSALPLVDEAVPLNGHFLWLDLGKPDPSPIILPVLVGGSMWVVQKMTASPSLDPNQQSMTRMMTWMWPLMFGFFTLSFPSGLALYWIVSNLVSIGLQYRVTGWGGLIPQPRPVPSSVEGDGKVIEGEQVATTAAPAPSATVGTGGIGEILRRIFLGAPPAGEPEKTAPTDPDLVPEVGVGEIKVQQREADGSSRKDRENSGRGYRKSTGRARGRPRGRRDRRRR